MALTRPRYSQIYDTDYKQSVRLATTTDVGNLLAGGSNITNTVDGKTVADNDRILVKDQSDGKQNGIYRVVTAGTGSDGTWIRALDADASDKVTSGMTTTITDGTLNINKTFKLATQDPITVGTTSLSFVDPFQITASAGGANTYVQFNDINNLGGSPGFTFNKYTNAVSITGSISTANISVNGNVSATRFFGDGSQLTGIDATSIQNSGTIVKTYNNGNVTITGNLVPSANLTYNLGSPTQRWATGYFAGNTIDLGGATISVDSSTGVFTFAGNSSGATTSLGGASTFNPAGDVSIGGNLVVTGAVYIAGNTSIISTNNVVYSDALIYLADGNPTDFLDIGFIGNFTRSALYSHTGFARDATDGVWKLFEGVEPEPTTTIDFGSASYATALIGNLVTRSNVTVGGNLRLGGALLTSAGLGGTPGQFLTSTGTGMAWVDLVVSSNSISDGDTNVIAEGNVVNVAINGTNVASFSSASTIFAGNVGIGNTSPTTPLEIYAVGTGNKLGYPTLLSVKVPTSQDSYAIAITNDKLGANYGLGIMSNGSTFVPRNQFESYGRLEIRTYEDAVNYQSYQEILLGYVASDPMTFRVGGSERMRIASSGNVGIGNTAPLHSLSINGNMFVGNIVTGADNVANIGTSTNRFRTVHARATQAQYADLAEIYASDRNYVPGTVVVFGGNKEVTISTTTHDPAVAGVVSTDPAYLMNGDADGVAVALQGRVPTRVKGPVSKGDRVVASDLPGVAVRLDKTLYEPGCIIGKSLEDILDDRVHTIEVVVGRN